MASQEEALLMGSRGPLPSASVRRRNARPGSDVGVPVGRPSMPRTLTGEAREEWKRVVPLLEKMGVLASVDRAVLIRYCATWADWCELDELLQRSGKLTAGRGGNLVRNPVWLMRRDADATVTELARQLFLTPSARLRGGITLERPTTEIPDAKVSSFERYSRGRNSG
jgi:P27 family predicted phage terminase small subunit